MLLPEVLDPRPAPVAQGARALNGLCGGAVGRDGPVLLRDDAFAPLRARTNHWMPRGQGTAP